MDKLIIKVCGMRDGENIRQVAELGVDWIGMVFWDQSPRNVTMIPTRAGIIPDRGSLPSSPEAGSTGSGQSVGSPSEEKKGRETKTVGVFVDEMAQNIITRVVNYQLSLIQLNGHETPTLIRNLRRTLDPDIRPGVSFIKRIVVTSRDDIAAYKDYADSVDYLLFDIKEPSASGGRPDWSILDAYDGALPFLLGGDIRPDDADSLLAADPASSTLVRALRHPKCIGLDLNIPFEAEPGFVDISKLKLFLGKRDQWCL